MSDLKVKMCDGMKVIIRGHDISGKVLSFEYRRHNVAVHYIDGGIGLFNRGDILALDEGGRSIAAPIKREK